MISVSQMAQTPSAMTQARFEDAITRAVTSRSRAYSHSFAMSIRWELDNTDAATDTENFKVILSTLNLDPPCVEIMGGPNTNKTPSWNLNGKLRSLFESAVNAPGKSLVIIHYAGHGEIRRVPLDERRDLLFAVEGPHGRAFSLQPIIDTIVDGYFFEIDLTDLDVVFILDCCYSHMATRMGHSTGRALEILAASDDTTPEALMPPRNTLTGKLRGEISRRKREGHMFIRLADVMANIRENSPVVKPTHSVKLGTSICIPFSGAKWTDPDSIAPTLRAVFSVRVSDNVTEEQMTRFIKWIETLPQAFAIELDAVYNTSSTLLVIQSAYALFTNLAGYSGVSLIGEVKSRNRRKPCTQEWPQNATSSTLKENIPFSSKSKQ